MIIFTFPIWKDLYDFHLTKIIFCGWFSPSPDLDDFHLTKNVDVEVDVYVDDFNLSQIRG